MGSPRNSADGAVVAGFDGSPSAEDGLVLARACRRFLGARLVVATVHPSPAPIGSGRVDAEWTAERHHQAENILDGARRLLADDDGVEYRVVASSSAAHGLHDLAEEVNASVIVVGSSGAAAQQRLFAGSTAQRLLSGSPSPVGVAPAGMRYRDTGPLSRIGVAYIDTPDGHAALDLAVRVATRAGASLELYSVLAEKAEVVMAAPVELDAIPQGLEVVGDRPDSVDVQLHGLRAVLARVGPEQVRAHVSLAGARAGEVVVRLVPDQISAPTGVTVLRVSPSRVRVMLETRRAETRP